MKASVSFKQSAVLALAVGCALAAAAPASANVTCNLNMTFLTINLTADGDSGEIFRNGNTIVVLDDGNAAGCNVTPTVSNTNFIDVNDTSGSSDTSFEVDLSGGPFASGNEIPIDVGTDDLFLVGSADPDVWTAGTTASAQGFNLNAGSEVPGDVDLTFSGVSRLEVTADAGDDKILADGGAPFTGPLSSNVQITGNEDGDTLAGGNGNDEIFDGEGDDFSTGGEGADIFGQPGAGSGDDSVDGGPGADELDLGQTVPATRLDLRLTGRQDTGGAGNDQVVGIESVQTGDGDDVVIGTDGANVIVSEGGDDLVAGLGGLDVLLGGGGERDTLTYETPPEGVGAGVTVDLAIAGGQDTGGAGIDSLNGFDNLIGSLFDDHLLGTPGPNEIEGLAGADVLEARGSADTLRIRDGAGDQASCGDGDDSVTADVEGTDTIAGDCESVDFDLRPDTSIDSGPASLSNDPTASFTFSSTKSGATFECSLDGAAFTPCASPDDLAPVADGAHSFSVRARDLLGAVDLTPAVRAFSVDTVAPVISGAKIAKTFRRGRARSFRYRLSEEATVTIRVQRCVRRRGKRCRRFGKSRTLTREGNPGANRNRFSSRRRGLFRATLTASDEAGNRSRSKRLSFTIVAG